MIANYRRGPELGVKVEMRGLGDLGLGFADGKRGRKEEKLLQS